MKADIDKVLTKKEAQAIHEIRDAYYKDIFVHNPDHKIDSTNYNYLIKSIFGGTLRGGGE
jgi:glycerol-3-phosphate cytidylyltransferase-like family protein